METVFIEKRMSEMGLSTEAFAERCLVAAKYMEQVLRGYRPSKRLIVVMAQVLGCEAERICPTQAVKEAV